MHNDLDAQLLRRFASAAEPLADAEFTAQLTARLEHARAFSFGLRGVYSILGTIVSGFGTGLLLSWRLKHARIMIVGAAAMTLWTAFL
jgi:hypothetical protein